MQLHHLYVYYETCLTSNRRHTC